MNKTCLSDDLNLCLALCSAGSLSPSGLFGYVCQLGICDQTIPCLGGLYVDNVDYHLSLSLSPCILHAESANLATQGIFFGFTNS